MTSVPDFDTICKHKESDSSNLNDVFASYGCDTLEAKVPVVNRPLIEQLKSDTADQQMLAALALKSESASWAMKGRAPRTRNKELRVVVVSGEVMLEAGEERERSPVDRGELDDELEAYARERARVRAKRMGIELPEFDEAPVVPRPRVNRGARKENDEENWDEEPEPEAGDLDDELDRYMQEAARKRSQKRQLVEQTDRMAAMMRMEDEDF